MLARSRIKVYTQDSVPQWRPLTRDEILEAQTPHKAIALGTVWDGYLKPKFDTLVEEAGKLHGFMLGHVVTAEPSPVIQQMLGRVWRGIDAMRSDLRRFADQTASEGPELERVDTTEALAAVEQLRQALGTEEINTAKFGDTVSRMRRAKDGVRPARSGSRRTGDFSKPVSVAEINQRNRDHWALQNGTATRDSLGAIRDAEHAVRTATDPRSLIQRINHLNRLKAAQNDYTPGTTNDDRQRAMDLAHLQTRSAPRTPAEINERNRQFWAAQK
jgi:hypothetical protein